MPKVVEIRTEPAICSISLHQAIYRENCNTISNSLPYRCGVCGSEAVLRENRFSTASLILRAELHSLSDSLYSARSELSRLASIDN
jgi:hypothetical protein